MDYMIIIVPAVGLVIATIWYDCISELKIKNLEARLSSLEASLNLVKQQVVNPQPATSHDVDIALLAVQQEHMGRCQSEQLWAIAGYVAITGYAISERNDFIKAIGKPALVTSFVVFAVVAFAFIATRFWAYYQHRYSRAEIAARLPLAPDYLKRDWNLTQHVATFRRLRAKESILWMTIFVLLLALPIAAVWKLPIQPEAPDRNTSGAGR